MKILIVTQYFWPETVPINDVAWGLAERENEVTVLTGVPNYPAGYFPPGYGVFKRTRQKHRGVRIVRVPLIPRGGGQRWRLALNYVSFTLAACLLGPLRCRGAFDLIFAFQMSPVTLGVPAILLKRAKRAPLMFWVQDLWPESLSASGAVSSPWLLKRVGQLVRFIYRHCDSILVQSRTFAPRVEAMGADPARVRYFPNWAEALYRPISLERGAPEREEMPEGFKVVFAGNIGAIQSFETILGAAARLKDHPEIHWVILGDGRMRPWVERRVRELGLWRRVHLLGRRPMETMPRYYALADALLVTLKKDPVISLTIPSKTQPYLASGRSLVAALDGEGAAVIKEAGAGLVVPAEDAGALARAVLKLYEMPPEEREQMGSRGRAYFEEHFEREMLLDRLESWMAELIRG
jgi:colanic acid biosynthesis glycosyl transferase WcaI